MWEWDCEEGWPLKNWCFWSVVLEKTLESPLEIDPTSPFCRRWVLGILWKEWCWSWNSSTLATSSRVDSLEKTLMLGGMGAGGKGDDRGWDCWMALLTRWTCPSKLRELVMDREAWRTAIHGVTKSWTWLSDRAELTLRKWPGMACQQTNKQTNNNNNKNGRKPHVRKETSTGKYLVNA